MNEGENKSCPVLWRTNWWRLLLKPGFAGKMNDVLHTVAAIWREVV
jgi:hypothetical protein